MKKDMQNVIELSEKTSFSRRKCERVLMEKNNNMDEALDYLIKLRRNPIEIIIDNISAYITGEKGKKFIIYDDEKVLLSFPVIFAILFLIFFDIASWIIALSIIFIIIFNIDFKIESSTAKKTKEDFGTIVVSEYQSNKINKNASSTVHNDGGSGYNEITIE